MTSIEFENEIKSSLHQSYEFIRERYFNKSIQFSNKPTYNSQLRIGETKEHLIAELLGSKDFEQKEEVQITTRAVERIADINFFILGVNKLDDKEIAILDVSKSSCNICGIFLATSKDKKETEERLGIRIVNDGLQTVSATIPIQFGKNSNNSLLHQVELLRTKSSNIYYRHISFLIIVKKSDSKLNFRKWFRDNLEKKWKEDNPVGIDSSVDNINVRMSRSLISLSEQNLSERVIDKFIGQHATMFAESMGYIRALPQIELKWVKKEPEDPNKSIPDYLMESKDGSFHIVDVKKGFLGRKLVKGIIGRERFIDYVAELVAQLKNYERYFDEVENRDYAKSKYGIEVDDEIKLVGIVGGYYEYDELAVTKVLRQYDKRISIISYFDLASLIKNNK